MYLYYNPALTTLHSLDNSNQHNNGYWTDQCHLYLLSSTFIISAAPRLPPVRVTLPPIRVTVPRVTLPPATLPRPLDKVVKGVKKVIKDVACKTLDQGCPGPPGRLWIQCKLQYTMVM